VALGANLDDPTATMVAAVRALARLGRVGAVSSLWRTDPVGGPAGQPAYRNAVLLWRPGTAWATPPRALAALLAIERALGRERRDRWGPRRIDLDLLAWQPDGGGTADGVASARGRGRLALPDLPHPRAFGRPFVLVPWSEVAPGWRHPRSGVTVGAAAAASSTGVWPVSAAERARWAAGGAAAGAGTAAR